jgi:hypothetical protein
LRAGLLLLLLSLLLGIYQVATRLVVVCYIRVF